MNKKGSLTETSPSPRQNHTMHFESKPGQQALRKGRYSQSNGIYFITTLTDQRYPWFREFPLACVMCRNLANREFLTDVTILCWVVMPDHAHLLLQLGNRPLHKVMNQLKSRSARQLNRKIGRSGRFWHHGFHDHALRKEENVVSIARYIVANPIRAGLVKRCGDYPFWDAVWV